MICVSNSPSVFGLVIMNTAVSSPSFAFKSSRSTNPLLLLLTVTASNPASTADAGLVPWAAVGHEHLPAVRAPPCRGSTRAATNRAVSSPCAPAAGWSDTAGSPLISARYLLHPVQEFEHPLYVVSSGLKRVQFG